MRVLQRQAGCEINAARGVRSELLDDLGSEMVYKYIFTIVVRPVRRGARVFKQPAQ